MSYFKRMEDPYISCPFNKEHKVLASKLQYHIVRCMVNYPDYMVCPYNACHRMVKEEYVQHVSRCPNKNLVCDNGDIGAGRIQGAMMGTNESFHFEFEDWTKE